jgi:hypothetical protein
LLGIGAEESVMTVVEHKMNSVGKRFIAPIPSLCMRGGGRRLTEGPRAKRAKSVNNNTQIQFFVK